MLKAEAIGRLTRDPEMRYTQSGKAVTNIRLACDCGKDDTEFIEVVAWEKLAETVQNNLTKGRLVYVEGRLQQREYNKQDGGKGKQVEIVAEKIRFLDYKKGEEAPPLPPEPTGRSK